MDKRDFEERYKNTKPSFEKNQMIRHQKKLEDQGIYDVSLEFQDTQRSLDFFIMVFTDKLLENPNLYLQHKEYIMRALDNVFDLGIKIFNKDKL